MVLAIVDLVSTAVSVVSGAGPLAGRVAEGLWQIALAVHRRFDRPGVLRRAGPVIVFALIAMWLLLLISGWALIFGQQDRLVDLDSGEPVAFTGRVYFAAATIIGRGTNIGQPGGDFWQALAEVAGATGVMLLSLGIAYVLPVVQGVVDKRQVAAYVSTLGTGPTDILERAWDGESLGDLNLHLIALTPMIVGLSQRHLAYPVIHYFHSGDRTAAVGPAIVALDELIMVNQHAIAREHRMKPTVTEPLRRALDEFLTVLEDGFISPAEREIAPPRLDDLDRLGVPFVDDGIDLDLPERTRARRRLLRAYLDHDGWFDLDLLPYAEA